MVGACVAEVTSTHKDGSGLDKEKRNKMGGGGPSSQQEGCKVRFGSTRPLTAALSPVVAPPRNAWKSQAGRRCYQPSQPTSWGFL